MADSTSTSPGATEDRGAPAAGLDEAETGERGADDTATAPTRDRMEGVPEHGASGNGAPADGTSRVLWFDEIGSDDVARVGGKAASLGEMYQSLAGKGLRVPYGFASTADAYDEFLDAELTEETWEGVRESDREGLLAEIDHAATLREALQRLFDDREADDHVEANARATLARELVLRSPVPDAIRQGLTEGYEGLCERYEREIDTAVRSSATREDSEIASFAGQYESFLNVRGADAVVDAWKRCCASAFTERAVSYQLERAMDPLGGQVSVVVMKMVRSDLATSGVMFTMDPESGNRNVIHISSSYGLGELVVQGTVSPDTFVVWKEGIRRGKPALVHRRLGAKDVKLVYSRQGATATESVDVEASRRRQWSLRDDEVLSLAEMALLIEEHYGRPMDIEWAKDGYSGDLFIVQARPETVHSSEEAESQLRTYSMDPALVGRLRDEGKVLLEGQAVGTRIGSGKVRVYRDYQEVIERKRSLRKLLKEGRTLDDIPAHERVFDTGDVLVTHLTTPDWEPMMKEASLVITEKGGRTSHAAIVAREFGIPSIVGADDATKILQPLQEVTGSCAEGDTGVVYEGIQPFDVETVDLEELPDLETEVKLNVGFPSKALQDARLPSDGVGLARTEFILTAQVGVHPLALRLYDELRAYASTGDWDPALDPYAERIKSVGREEVARMLGAIERRTPAYGDRRQFFVERVKQGVALICAAFYPRPVLVRLSDLKSNEYRELLGGRLFEPHEENPMIAWRGAARYIDPPFLPAFDMECEALTLVRQELGLDNLQIMIPFCRTPEEGREVVRRLDQHGLSKQAGVPIYLMIELPSNVVEADRFIEEMDLEGGSIGSNDLVQTVYAVSRDDLEHYHHPVDARSPAVQAMIRQTIEGFREQGLEIGICGQA
ncbi:MAG: pyruvate, water dikinase, partial [Longimicrobiales bacterium]|nr:pyruvate, water dikinase [Longimicrobiales bacterium]